MNDNDIPIPQLTTTVASPGHGWLPTLSRTVVDLGNRRPQIAKTIERALGQIAVSRFDGPRPIKYAKSTSPVVFGEFKAFNVEHKRQPAVMFTVVDYDWRDRGSVAICLFGSMDNFPEYVQAAGPGFDGGPLGEGWVSSSAPAVYNFIRSHGKQLDDPYYTPERMAEEALKIADSQGVAKALGADNASLGLDKAWERSFTYGEVAKAQWLAEIYLDVDLLATPESTVDGFRRVLVGAPLWVRTPDLRAIELYAKSDPAEPTPPPPGSSQQALFHQAEIRSLVWAAAALTTARVINRPGSHGFGGRTSGSTSVLRHRAGLPEREPEVFASHASAVLAPPGEAAWWLQHQRSRVTSPADAVVSDQGPYRAGRIPADSQALVACVTGRRVFILGEVSQAAGKRVRQLSRQAAEALGLTFTTMAWRLAGSAAPELGRVNPCPSLAELGDSWAPIRAALLRELCP